MGNKQSNTYLIPFKGGTIQCDRVTSILGATKASAGLANWYGVEERKGLQAMVVNGQDILSLPLDNPDDFFGSRVRDMKADSGTGIHALINCDATGEKLPDDIVLTPKDWERYKFWEDLKEREGIEYVDSELRVYSPNLLVAGTMDLSVLWKGVLWALDTKTGRLKRDAATQVVCYWMLRHETMAIQEGNEALLEEIAEAYAHGAVPNIKWPRMGVLHIEEDGVEIYEIDPALADQLARNFLFRLQIFRDDQTIRPFRRIYPGPKVLKNGTVKPAIWLRAS
jgi:hypothetical protein